MERPGQITLEHSQFGNYLITHDDGRDILVDIDYEYTSLASTFGWCPCDCGYTDGTVDCDHRTAGDMITEAAQYLDDHIDDTVEDPGYFE